MEVIEEGQLVTLVSEVIEVAIQLILQAMQLANCLHLKHLNLLNNPTLIHA